MLSPLRKSRLHRSRDSVRKKSVWVRWIFHLHGNVDEPELRRNLERTFCKPAKWMWVCDKSNRFLVLKIEAPESENISGTKDVELISKSQPFYRE